MKIMYILLFVIGLITSRNSEANASKLLENLWKKVQSDVRNVLKSYAIEGIRVTINKLKV